MAKENEELTFYQRVQELQNNVKVGKNKWNDFSKFKYRSYEDILEELKPILSAYGILLHVEDKIVNIGERYYVEATTTFIDMKDPTMKISSTGYAREAENQKGMNAGQLSGSTSSFARKYAIQGLLLLDEQDDLDSNSFNKGSWNNSKWDSNANNNKKYNPNEKKQKVSTSLADKDKLKAFYQLVQEKNISADKMKEIMEINVGKEKSTDLTNNDIDTLMTLLKGL